MTREEAIFTIEHRDSIMDYGETEQLAEALDMALEALKAEPSKDDMLKIEGMCEDAYEQGYQQARLDYETEPCGDCVSREAVFDAIIWDEENGVADAREIIEHIRKLPSVTPAIPEGCEILTKEAYSDLCLRAARPECPYTDKPCATWNCTECEVNEEERKWMEEDE